MSQAFYRKWRPQKWDEVVAQEHVIQTLRNAVRSGRIGHAYLLAGPRGTGKTTTARLLAKALNCLDSDPANRPCDNCEHCKSVNEGRYLDLMEIDAASNTSVEDVRDLREKINFRPSQGEYKVYIIDEVHMLSTAAFNALLKTLEEPPPHAYFILATTEVHKIPATILSRCQRYDFRRIPVEDIRRHLKNKAAEEGILVDDDALLLIARQATGAMRDAISLLDQLSSTGERVTLAEAQMVLGTATSNSVVELVESVIAGDAAAGLKTIQYALDAGTDARQFARQVVDYLRNLLLVRMGNADQVDATREMRDQIARHARALESARLLEAIHLFNNAAVDSRSAWHPGLGLELALAEAIESLKAPAPEPAQPAQSVRAAAEPKQPPQTEASQRAARLAQNPPEEPGAMLYQHNEEPEQAAPSQAAPSQPRTTPRQNEAPKSSGGVEKSPAAKPATPGEKTAAVKPAAGAKPAQNPPGAGAPEESQPAGGGKAVTQAEVQQQWPRIKQMVKKRSPMAEGLLNSARSIVLKGSALVLGFQSEVVKSKMETAENLDILRAALQSALGTSLTVRCTVVGNKSASPSDLEVDGDGMVGTALDLGGMIVHEE